MHTATMTLARHDVVYETERMRLQSLYQVEPDPDNEFATLTDPHWSHYNAFVQVNRGDGVSVSLPGVSWGGRR